MTDLAEFLLARIAEDEADATSPDAEAIGEDDHPDGYYKWVTPGTGAYGIGIKRTRLVADCAAKRQIVEEHRPSPDSGRSFGCFICMRPAGQHCTTMRIIASVYADHPDYRQEWKS